MCNRAHNRLGLRLRPSGTIVASISNFVLDRDDIDNPSPGTLPAVRPRSSRPVALGGGAQGRVGRAMTKSPRRRLVQMALVAVACFGAAQLGRLLQLPGTSASPVSPASGIGLAAMLLAGPAVWPGVLAAAFLANATTLPFSAGGLLAAAAIALGNVAEPLVAVWLIGRVS
jgi:hypothetical protein